MKEPNFDASHPELTFGNHPDGSPWLISTFFHEEVYIDAYGVLRDRGNKTTAKAARLKAAALLAGADWLEEARTPSAERARATSARSPVRCHCGEYTATDNDDLDEHVLAMMGVEDGKSHG